MLDTRFRQPLFFHDEHLMNSSQAAEFKRLAPIVFTRYHMDARAQRLARDCASRSPVHVLECYRAIVNSIRKIS